jgi:demethylmenaquinone methyltransferase/2-methoxy-6-polyprenyl-1,4-benzoquinol methylase
VEVPVQVSRVARSKEDARRSYDRLSRWYDVLAGSSERRYRELGLQLLQAQPAEQVLEIGFGTGHAILALCRAVGATGRVAGIDLSPAMAAITQQRLQQVGLNADLRVGDAVNLPFESQSFDAVFMSFTLELFDTPEIPLVLGQCRRVLRPAGRLGLVTLVKRPGLAVRIYEWFHRVWPAAVDCRPILAQADLRQAGFVVQDCIALAMWGLPVEVLLARLE